MKAEILAVGTELLLGDIVNTNAQYLSRELAKLGIPVYFQTVVGDNAERLLSAYEQAFSRADMVITTGGLGPTEDDITKEIAARYFHREMVLDPESLAHVEGYFKGRGAAMTQNNLRQATIPTGAKTLYNANGTAPGCMLEEDGKILIMIPGPPAEAIPMFENEVSPFLKTKSDGIFLSRTLRICGIGESMLEDMLKDLIDTQTNPSIAPYAKTAEVHLRVTASGRDEEEAARIMEPTVCEIYKRLGNHIYGENDTALETAVVRLLLDKQYTIACAESCTGGMLSSALVDCPGVSEVLLESVVSYSNASKKSRLGVKAETLDVYGAVSAECAVEMAEGIAKSSGARIGISTTGIAGPGGGTETKPVGLVCIGLWIDGKSFAKEYRFKGDRQKIRNRAMVTALDLIRRELV